MRAGLVRVLLVSTLFLAPVAPRPALADWPQFGRALCTAPGSQGAPAVAPDGAGGAIVTWNDRRSFPFNIDAQHVLASGAVDVAWPTDGRALLTDSLAQSIVPVGQELPAIASDGAGGAIVTWPDGRSILNGLDIYAHHILASGAVDGTWPVNGTTVCTVTGQQEHPLIVSDGARGAFVTWLDRRSSVTGIDIYAQHVLASGLVDGAWPANGTAICTAPGTQAAPAIVEDGVGGEIVAWNDLRSAVTKSDIYAQHLLSSGAVDPAWPANGLALCTAVGAQALPKIISDGAHGAIVTWHDARDGVNHIYAQRVLAAGAIAAGWPADGRAISTSGIDEVAPTLVSDGASGAIVAWGDARNGFHDMRAQHVLATGALDAAWPVSGTALSNTPSEENFQVMVSDGAGGTIVTWQVSFDIVAQHVLASGVLDPAFPIDGRPLCNLPSLQENPAMVADGANGAIVTWMDKRGGIDFDIYALQVLAAGTTDVGDATPREISFARPNPNPAFGVVTLRFALPRETRVRLGIYDLSGRRVRQLASGARPAGDHTIEWDLRDEAGHAVGAGLYFARLEAEGRALTQKLATVK